MADFIAAGQRFIEAYRRVPDEIEMEVLDRLGPEILELPEFGERMADIRLRWHAEADQLAALLEDVR